MDPSKAFLIILDGWGLGPTPAVSAIARAQTPFMDSLYDVYPHSELITYGEDVGLPEGQMGNSEVGHLNIGAGRVVYQELARINKSVREGELARLVPLQETLDYAAEQGKAVHLLGLLSDGGVHAHIRHLLALTELCRSRGQQQVFVHAFLDGRDTDPHSGAGFLQQLLDRIADSPVRLASMIGRYYAMDRDKRWERVKKAYDLLVHGQGTPSHDMWKSLKASYEAGISDEFVEPVVAVDEAGRPLGVIGEGDVVIFFNFRTDRPRELTTVLSQQDMPEWGMYRMPLRFLTFTRYDEQYEGIRALYEKEDIRDTLGEVLSSAGRTQLRIAETEKYPHVTFFFSGGREEPFEGESRILIPSPRVATYDLQPEMSAEQTTDAVLESIRSAAPDFICLNYANTDMVGHTGVMSAAEKAAETVDRCLARLVPEALDAGYRILIIADHGNADYMVNPDGSPNTAHTKNPVPCILVSRPAESHTLRYGRLADVAPTLLELMGIPQPAAMTGSSLLD